MSQHSISVNVLGHAIAFRPGADIDRVQRAANLVEKLYANQKTGITACQSKDILLTYVALALADDMLQMKKMQDNMEQSLENLLCEIEKSL